MMRLRPCDDPRVCGGVKRSQPTTWRPRCAAWYAAALPTAPRPAISTSKGRVTAPLSAGAQRARQCKLAEMVDDDHGQWSLRERPHKTVPGENRVGGEEQQR